ncbi:bile acid:sodium symporter family protein [Seohaeicola saemankumensis]|nr:bile acid:sodium symporter family protein [Seohaeicola saemankumensis]MCA0873207.1 bile acid:sodium symporter family protein [Seohaeicola saemankumensis]
MISMGLPLSLAIIMLSLGIGLEVSDFRRVALSGYAFVIGAVSQVILLPLAAFGIASLCNLPPEIAVGFMLLSFCPGGVTSNILSKWAGGDVALSISLTAVISLLSILTVPVFSTLAITYFMGADAPPVNVTALAVSMFLITTLPVAVGVTIRQYYRGIAIAIEQALSYLALIIVAVIVAAALAANWSLFIDNLNQLGGALIALNVALLLIGLGVAYGAGLSWPQVKTISIETGIQNSTLGITVAGLLTGVTQGFSAMALPSAVYGITMYAVALPLILWMRGRR